MNACSVCHGKTVQKYITYTQWYHGELVAIENVPAEVCETCNEEYFSPETVDKLQTAIEIHHSNKTIQVPVFQIS